MVQQYVYAVVTRYTFTAAPDQVLVTAVAILRVGASINGRTPRPDRSSQEQVTLSFCLLTPRFHCEMAKVFVVRPAVFHLSFAGHARAADLYSIGLR